MIGPIYGQGAGLATDQITRFLAAYVPGGALSHYRASRLADKYDRHWMLVWLSGAAILTCVFTAAAPGFQAAGVMFTAGLCSG